MAVENEIANGFRMGNELLNTVKTKAHYIWLLIAVYLFSSLFFKPLILPILNYIMDQATQMLELFFVAFFALGILGYLTRYGAGHIPSKPYFQIEKFFGELFAQGILGLLLMYVLAVLLGILEIAGLATWYTTDYTFHNGRELTNNFRAILFMIGMCITNFIFVEPRFRKILYGDDVSK